MPAITGAEPRTHESTAPNRPEDTHHRKDVWFVPLDDRSAGLAELIVPIGRYRVRMIRMHSLDLAVIRAGRAIEFGRPSLGPGEHFPDEFDGHWTSSWSASRPCS